MPEILPDQTENNRTSHKYKLIFELPDNFPLILRVAWRYKFVALNTLAALAIASETNLLNLNMFPIWIATAAIYISGRIADSKTTIDFFDLQQKYPHEIKEFEACGALPDHPTRQDIIGGTKQRIDALNIIPGIICPPFGIIGGITSWAAAVYNRKSLAYYKEVFKEV